MNVKINFILSTNPFIDAYFQSDLLGKLIFIGLLALSICSWIIILHKVWITYQAKKYSTEFYQAFQQQRATPLAIDCELHTNKQKPNPFLDLYSVLKKHTVDILNKNRRFGAVSSPELNTSSYLSPSDIEFVDTHLMSAVANQIQDLEKNLFILSTIVSLGPFLGLLGTVWGILSTFSEMQAQAGGSTNQMILGGLSLALATTVLGLIDAIPALIGYNYLKNTINSFQTDMDGFSTEILAAVEMQYRKVDVK
ncbi:MAG: MotA/TolQ/ExbB proton channel family protein [Parachlamydiaceae bacterium]|nr:MotA/TolQ/ExbB proton channel family protein [Parachlamydiaceae bacterium]